MKIVYTLSSDSMLGREAGSKGEEMAAKYLESYYKETGLSPFMELYVQKFPFLDDSMHNDIAKNIIGFIDNKADSTIIVGAHYDHLGLGGTKSRSLTSKKIHHGADDNASGVAVMLMLAEYLNKSKLKFFNYLFIAFSAHEVGLFGSEAFITENKQELTNVKLMINLDMVGRLDTISPKLKAIRNSKDNYIDSILINEQIGRKFNLSISEGISPSDASVFWENNIPAITFTTGIHDDYHKTSDIAEKINYYGMNEITEYIIRVIVSMKSNKLIIIN
ncbi:MAG: DUF4910 domain-containing protein [Bacteroidota bacterium]